ncbi:MAG: hypothetical protein E7559_05140 [Ruminococcaceae bacterium]|nr:hypothetical protein [Oscillospiraceae bacterium]
MKKENNTEKKNNGKKKNKGCLIGLAIAGGLLALLILLVALLPSLLFTDYQGLPTTGKYDVEMASAILVDENRTESFESDGSNREVPVYFFYPDTASGSFPLVVFSHGAFGYYQSNMSTYMELASHGYVVVSLDHPYHSFFTKDTDGKTVIVNPEFMQQVMYINDNAPEEEIISISHEWLRLRTDDMNFALDTIKKACESGITDAWHIDSDSGNMENILSLIDTDRIGLMGHSMGGAASVTLGRTRDDIDAVINLDGTMLGEQYGYKDGEYDLYEESYPVPLLFVSNEAHHYESQEVEELYVNNVVLENAVDARYTYFVGSGHMNFTDLPLFSPKLAEMLGTGEVDAKECIVTMNELILDYYNCCLKDMGEAVVEECYG